MGNNLALPGAKGTRSTQCPFPVLEAGLEVNGGVSENAKAQKEKRGKLSPPSKRRVLGLNSELAPAIISDRPDAARFPCAQAGFQKAGDLTLPRYRRKRLFVNASERMRGGDGGFATLCRSLVFYIWERRIQNSASSGSPSVSLSTTDKTLIRTISCSFTRSLP